MKLNSKFKVQNSKLLILIASIVAIGVAIYSQQAMRITTSPIITLSPPQLKTLSENLTYEERFVLHPPQAEASNTAKQKHAKMVSKLASAAASLDITNCEPKPVVLRVKKGNNFTVKNNDKQPHKIMLDEKTSYEIPANGSLVVKADFNYGAGDYGYVCEGAGLVGFLHVTK